MKNLFKICTILIMIFSICSCSTASDMEDLSKQNLEISKADTDALNDFLKGNIEDDGVPAVEAF